jgi:hypothetical protein
VAALIRTSTILNEHEVYARAGAPVSIIDIDDLVFQVILIFVIMS